MNTIRLASRCALFAAVLTTAPAALAIEAGQIDDFEDGTVMGWAQAQGSPNPPFNSPSGGPQPPNDNYLVNQSSGTAGQAGGRMMMFNLAQWTGNYAAERIASIRMWLCNEGFVRLRIRVALRRGNTWYASTNAFPLPADVRWYQADFELNADNLTRVEGTASLDHVLNNVEELRILSAESNPDHRGDVIAAVLGIDDIEAVAKAAPVFQQFLDLVSLNDVNGNNNTDLGVLRFDPTTSRNRLTVFEGRNGNEIRTIVFGRDAFRGGTVVSDANGDLIPEYGVLLEGSLYALVRDVVNDVQLGRPTFNAQYDPVAFLAVGNAGGGAGPDVAMVGRDADTGKVQAWVKDVSSGNLVNRLGFNKAFLPLAAVAVDDTGNGPSMWIAVLGINSTGTIKAQVKDPVSGDSVGKPVKFSNKFLPLYFAAAYDESGKPTRLAVLGINAAGSIQAQIKDVSSGALVSKVRFSKQYIPVAFFAFADSNGSGGGEVTVVGVSADGAVRAETREIADDTPVSKINFNQNYPPLAAIAVNGVAGTGRNEIVVLGQHENGEQQLQVKDVVSGSLVRTITLP